MMFVIWKIIDITPSAHLHSLNHDEIFDVSADCYERLRNYWGSVLDTYQALTSQSCVYRGDFGPFIYLLSYSRVCFICLCKRKEVLPLLPSHAKKDYGLGSKALSSLPRFRNLPGVYSLTKTQHRCRRFGLIKQPLKEPVSLLVDP